MQNLLLNGARLAWNSFINWIGSSSTDQARGTPNMEAGVAVRCGRRSGHISFTDGRNLYVWGGFDPVSHDYSSVYYPGDEVWVYLVSLDSWILKKCRGDIPRGTSGSSHAILPPYLYVICGHNQREGHTSTVRRLHLDTFTWEIVKVQGLDISPRDKFSSWAYDNKIYCFGGYGIDPTFTDGYHTTHGQFIYELAYSTLNWNNQLMIFDPETRRWSNPKVKSLETVPSPRAAHATVLLGDKVYLFGGRSLSQRLKDLYCLHLKTLTWSGKIEVHGPIPEGRSWHTLTALDQDRIFLYGGYSQNQEVFDDGWIYSVSGQSWTNVISQNGQLRAWHTAVITEPQDILIFGGFSSDINSGPFDLEDFPDHIVKIDFQPHSLKDLCLEMVYNQVPAESWNQLPKVLETWLHSKQKVQADWLALPSSKRSAMGPHCESGWTDTDSEEEMEDIS